MWPAQSPTTAASAAYNGAPPRPRCASVEKQKSKLKSQITGRTDLIKTALISVTRKTTVVLHYRRHPPPPRIRHRERPINCYFIARVQFQSNHTKSTHNSFIQGNYGLSPLPPSFYCCVSTTTTAAAITATRLSRRLNWNVLVGAAVKIKHPLDQCNPVHRQSPPSILLLFIVII